jgi:hypothetical protein
VSGINVSGKRGCRVTGFILCAEAAGLLSVLLGTQGFAPYGSKRGKYFIVTDEAGTCNKREEIFFRGRKLVLRKQGTSSRCAMPKLIKPRIHRHMVQRGAWHQGDGSIQQKEHQHWFIAAGVDPRFAIKVRVEE